MDSRKIQFLINLQSEIDKLEKNAEDPKRLEKLKSRFYELAGVEDIAIGKYPESIDKLADEMIKTENRDKLVKFIKKKQQAIDETSNFEDSFRFNFTVKINDQTYIIKTLGEYRMFHKLLKEKTEYIKEIKEGQKPDKHKPPKELHYPQNTANFLADFAEKLRDTTHPYSGEEEFDLKKFRSKEIRIPFLKLEKKYKNLPVPLTTKMVFF